MSSGRSERSGPGVVHRHGRVGAALVAGRPAASALAQRRRRRGPAVSPCRPIPSWAGERTLGTGDRQPTGAPSADAGEFAVIDAITAGRWTNRRATLLGPGRRRRGGRRAGRPGGGQHRPAGRRRALPHRLGDRRTDRPAGGAGRDGRHRRDGRRSRPRWWSALCAPAGTPVELRDRHRRRPARGGRGGRGRRGRRRPDPLATCSTIAVTVLGDLRGAPAGTARAAPGPATWWRWPVGSAGRRPGWRCCPVGSARRRRWSAPTGCRSRRWPPDRWPLRPARPR